MTAYKGFSLGNSEAEVRLLTYPSKFIDLNKPFTSFTQAEIATLTTPQLIDLLNYNTKFLLSARKEKKFTKSKIHRIEKNVRWIQKLITERQKNGA